MRGLFRTASLVVVLDDVDAGRRLLVSMLVTLGGGVLPTLCGGSLLMMLVNVLIASAWRIFLLAANDVVFCRAFRRWPAAMSVLSASEMVGTVQCAG